MCETFLAGLPPNSKDQEKLPCSASNSTSLPSGTSPPPTKSLMPPCAKNEQDLELFIECSLDIYTKRQTAPRPNNFSRAWQSSQGQGQCLVLSSSHPSSSHSAWLSLFVPGTCVCLDGCRNGALEYSVFIFFVSSVHSSRATSLAHQYTHTRHTLWYLSEVPGGTPCWNPSWGSSHCHRHAAGFVEGSTVRRSR